MIKPFLLTFFFAIYAFGAAKKQESPLKLFAAGDVVFLGRMAERAKQKPPFPFEAVRNLWKDDDIVFVNLEGPLTDSTERTKGKDPAEVAAGKDFILKSPAQCVQALKQGGVTVVSLANNHTMDFGSRGVRDTIHLLKKHGIAASGAGSNRKQAASPVLIRSGDFTVALLSFSCVVPALAAATDRSPGIARLKTDEDRLLATQSIKDARKRADFVIVSLHWGIQGARKSSPLQRNLAYDLVDAGADLILGHHPHVLQETAVYKRKPIIYSMGNFVFGSRSVQSSAIYELHLSRPHNVTLARTIPVTIRNGRPEVGD